MYETLEGRVKYEATDRGLRLLVPMRRGPFAIIYGPLIGIWLALAAVRYTHLLSGPHPEDLNFNLQLVAIAIYIIGGIYFLGWLAWTLTGQSVVTLDPPEVKIATRVLGIDVSVRIFRNEEIHRVRYVPPRRMKLEHSMINPNTSCIQFEVHGKTHKFAHGIGKDESRALIDRMLLVHAFPRSWF